MIDMNNICFCLYFFDVVNDSLIILVFVYRLVIDDLLGIYLCSF